MSQATVGRPKTEAAEFTRFSLRIPPEMDVQIRTLADKERRPLNLEILQLLEFALEHYQPGVAGLRRRKAS